MKVTIVDFYAEVTGAKGNVSTPTARAALDRWQIPYDTTTPPGALKKFWKVDVAHLTNAMTLHKAEIFERNERKNAARPKPPVTEQINPIYTIMERMAAIEQTVAEIQDTLTKLVAKF